MQELNKSEIRLLNLIFIAVGALVILPVGIACVILGFGLKILGAHTQF